MPRGPSPQWRRRLEPITDDWILASVERAGGIGRHDPANGHYAELIIDDLADKAEADEYRKSLFRCAHYLNRNGIAPVSMSADRAVRVGSKYQIRFRAVDKTMAKAFVLAKHGTDRSKWPYDPRRKGAA